MGDKDFMSVKITSTEKNQNVNVNPDFVTHSELEDELENYQPVGDYATQDDIEALHDEIISIGGVKFVEESAEE